jgi:hypothetical protein
MSNWYEAWADRYAEWSAGVTADVPFYVALAREADGLLVELAVGNGRVAIPVAQATGRRVVDLEGEGQCSRSIRPRNSNYSDWFSDTKTALRNALVA